MSVQRSTLASSLKPQAPSLPRGFTMVEMVVVIGIIVLLLALTVGVITTMNRGSESRRTQDMLTSLDGAYNEWKTNSERDITYGKPDEPQNGMTYEIEQTAAMPDAPSSTDHEPTDVLIASIHKSAPVRSLLANISSEMLKPHGTELTVVDTWDTEIITVFPGRLWVQSDQALNYERDDDGTIHTEFEDAFGECVNRRVRFVSAGPDGKFGFLNTLADPPVPPPAEAKDNIYSYPLEAES